jgi:hypothetical protein
MATPPPYPPPPDQQPGQPGQQPPASVTPYGPPPGYGAPPQGYGPPPGYGAPPQGYGPPPGYGAPPAGPGGDGPSTDGVSIAGLVCAFLLPPLGLVLSIVGLVRTSGGRRKGRGLAVAGVVVSVVLSLLLALVTVLAVRAGQAFLDQVEQGTFELEDGTGPDDLGLPSPGGADPGADPLDPAAAQDVGATQQVGPFEVTVTDIDLDGAAAVGAPPGEERVVLARAEVENVSDSGQVLFIVVNASYLSASAVDHGQLTCPADAYEGNPFTQLPLGPGDTTEVVWCFGVPPDQVGGGTVVLEPVLGESAERAAWRDGSEEDGA